DLHLTVWVVQEIVPPFNVMPDNVSAPDLIGTRICRPVAPLAGATLKVSRLAPNAIGPNIEPFRASSHVSICFAETIGTPRLCAAVTIASEPADAIASVCMFAVNTPKYPVAPIALSNSVLIVAG